MLETYTFILNYSELVILLKDTDSVSRKNQWVSHQPLWIKTDLWSQVSHLNLFIKTDVRFPILTLFYCQAPEMFCELRKFTPLSIGITTEFLFLDELIFYTHVQYTDTVL